MEYQKVGLNYYVPLAFSSMKIEEDSDTGIKSLIIKGNAHGYDVNKKFFRINQKAAIKATKIFKENKEAGRIHEAWIDHEYIYGSKSDKVIGHVQSLEAGEKGLGYVMSISTDHPSQIHRAIQRRDIQGISIGADVDTRTLLCSECQHPIRSSKCEHMIGEKLDNGKIVFAEVNDYIIDELSITSKPADPDGSIQFSLFTKDDTGKLLSNNITQNKDELLTDNFKKNDKYNRRDNNMTDKDLDTNPKLTIDNKEVITKDEFDGLKTQFTELQESMNSGFSAIQAFVKTQNDEKEASDLKIKQSFVAKIVQGTQVFDEKELLEMDVTKLEKLVHAFAVKSTGGSPNKGSAIVYDQDQGSDEGKEDLQLSFEDKKKWLRLKLGWKFDITPEVRAQVRENLYGEKPEENIFLSYLQSKDEKGD